MESGLAFGCSYGVLSFGLWLLGKFLPDNYCEDIELRYTHNSTVLPLGGYTFLFGLLIYYIFYFMTSDNFLVVRIIGYVGCAIIILRLIHFLYFYFFKSGNRIDRKVKKNIEKRLNSFIRNNNFFTKEEEIIIYKSKIYYNVSKEGKLLIKIRLDGSKFNEKYKDIGIALANLFEMKLKDYKENLGCIIYELGDGNIDYISLDSSCYGKKLNDCSNTKMKFNNELIWDFTKQPHALINGATGGGKSYLLFYILRNLISINATVYIVDPKKSDLSYLSVVGLDVADSKGTILKTLRIATEEMENRYEEMKNNENYRMGSNYDSLGMKPIFVIIDEYTALMASLDSKEKKELESYITNIILKGRQAGVFIIIAMQRADANVLNANLRDNLGMRVSLGKLSPDGYAMTFGQEFRDCSSTITDLLGKNSLSGCGFMYLDGATSTPQEFYAPLMKDYDLIEDIRAFNLKNE